VAYYQIDILAVNLY